MALWTDRDGLAIVRALAAGFSRGRLSTAATPGIRDRTCPRQPWSRGTRVRSMAEIKLGALVWNQYTDWPSLRDAGVLVDSLGFDSLWTWDHVYPIVGDYRGPMFEGY